MGQPLSLYLDLRPEQPVYAAVSALSPGAVLHQLGPLQGGLAGLKDLAHRLNPKARYTRAVVAAYPASQFLRHAVLENPSKARDEHFFADFLQAQYQLELAQNAVMILNPATGTPVDFDKVVPKEIVIAGALQKDIIELQNQLVASGIYPERLELGTVATLGGLIHYQRAQAMGSCVVHLQWGPQQLLFSICSAKRVELSRVIPFGTQSILEEIKNDLHLKDLEMATKVLSTGSFDFKEMGPLILKRLIKELQASAGFFEVQTGQPLKHFVLTLLPSSLGWVQDILSQYLGLQALPIDYQGWANTLQLSAPKDKEKSPLPTLEAQHLGLVSLMAHLEAAK